MNQNNGSGWFPCEPSKARPKKPRRYARPNHIKRDRVYLRTYPDASNTGRTWPKAGC